MRIALLTIVEPDAEPGAVGPADLRIGAHSIARHQLALCLLLGCQRIVCLASAFTPTTAALQAAAEAAGASFHLTTSALGLDALVGPADELFALASGLLAWPPIAMAALGEGPVVLVQPSEAGARAGFERLDLATASAGALRIPGRLVGALAPLGGDVDVFSALQRAAIQAGVPTRLLPPAAAEAGRWELLRSEPAAYAVEAAWMRLCLQGGAGGPSALAARRLARLVGPALLHAGSGVAALIIGAGVVVALALAAGWFGQSGLALLLCAPAWLTLQLARLLAEVDRQSLGEAPGPLWRLVDGEWLIDGLLLVLASDALPPAPGLARGFAPLVLLGLIRLVAPRIDARWRAWIEDRALLAGALAVAAGLGVLGAALEAAALGLLAGGIITARETD